MKKFIVLILLSFLSLSLFSQVYDITDLPTKDSLNLKLSKQIISLETENKKAINMSIAQTANY